MIKCKKCGFRVKVVVTQCEEHLAVQVDCACLSRSVAYPKTSMELFILGFSPNMSLLSDLENTKC